MSTHVDIAISVKAPETEINATVRKLVRKLRPATWGSLTDEQIALKVISGGITNCLYRATNCVSGEAVLVRIFGEKTEILIDRAKDNKTFALLADKGFGPTFVGTFDNGRVEGYMPSRPLEPSEMGLTSPVDFVTLIAEETARMHTLDMPDSREPILWKVRSPPCAYAHLLHWRLYLVALRLSNLLDVCARSRTRIRSPLLAALQFLDKWCAMAAEITFDAAASDPKEVHKANKFTELDVARISRELEWLKTVLPSDRNGHGQGLLHSFAASLSSSPPSASSSAPSAALPALPSLAASHTSSSIPRADTPSAQARIDAAAFVYRVVYAHNDLLSGNILHVETPESIAACAADSSSPRVPTGSPTYHEDRVQIIDYEYGGYNYCGFDIANHFCEHAGFDFDLDKWYPTRETQYRWFRAYLNKIGVAIPTAASYSSQQSAVGSASGAAAAASEDEVSAAFLDEMFIRSNQFALASHCWWGLWAIVQARHSPIDFDFITYSGERFKGYDKHKAMFFPHDATLKA